MIEWRRTDCLRWYVGKKIRLQQKWVRGHDEEWRSIEETYAAGAQRSPIREWFFRLFGGK